MKIVKLYLIPAPKMTCLTETSVSIPTNAEIIGVTDGPNSNPHLAALVDDREYPASEHSLLRLKVVVRAEPFDPVPGYTLRYIGNINALIATLYFFQLVPV